MQTMNISNVNINTAETKVLAKVSRTLEAARRLKGSIVVNDPALYIH